MDGSSCFQVGRLGCEDPGSPELSRQDGPRKEDAASARLGQSEAPAATPAFQTGLRDPLWPGPWLGHSPAPSGPYGDRVERAGLSSPFQHGP